MRALVIALVGVALVGVVVASAGCPTPCEKNADCPEAHGCRDGFCVQECLFDRDCPVGLECDGNALCVLSGAGEIKWLAPLENEQVGERFDATVEVTFRSPTGVLRVQRQVQNRGEECAPFIPVEMVLAGDQDQLLTQQVTLPGLFALGDSFTLAASLETALGDRVALLPLSSSATGYGGAVVESPPEGEVNADALSVEVIARVDNPVDTKITVEPLDSPSIGVTSFLDDVFDIDGFHASVPRGPHILWVDTASTRCGRGLVGVGDALNGLELGLKYSGAERGLLHLSMRIDGQSVCTFDEPGTDCVPVDLVPGPALYGEEIVSLPNIGDGVVEVAVMTGAIGPPMLAEVRVSQNGRHVGWLGPYPVQTQAGETWIAGDIFITGGIAELQFRDDTTFGAPW